MAEKHGESVEISKEAYLAAVVVAVGVLFQAAYVKTVYNIPMASIEATFNNSFCLSGKCSDAKTVEMGSVVFWSLSAVAEPLGTIPAVLTGTNTAEKYGRISTMLFASVPALAGLVLQSVSRQLRSPVLILIGRCLQAFGSTWLVVAGKAFLVDLLFPRIKPHTLFSVINVCFCACLLAVSSIGVPLGTVELWPWLNAVSGGMHLFLICALIIIPEPPKFLVTISEKIELHRSLRFYYSSPITIETFKFQILSDNFWGRTAQVVEKSVLDMKRSLTINEVIQRQRKTNQISQIYTIILCEILRTLVMSNVIYLFSSAALRRGMETEREYANFQIIAAFVTGLIASLASVRLGKCVRKIWVRILCAGIVLVSVVGFSVLGFLKQFCETRWPILDLLFFFCLFFLFAGYNFGLGTLPRDTAMDQLTLAASHSPVLSMASAIGKAVEVPVVGCFFPAMVYLGPGYAWLIPVLCLAVCFVLLLFWLPKKRFQTPSHESGLSQPKIPLLIYPEVESPSVAPGQIHRSASFCDPSGVKRMSRADERKGSAPAARRAKSASPRRRKKARDMSLPFPIPKQSHRNYLDVQPVQIRSLF